MTTRPSPSASTGRRWWQRLAGDRHQGPHGLPPEWNVLDGPRASTEVAVGPGGVFLLDHRRVRPEESARLAGELSGRLTAATGRCTTAYPVLVEPAGAPLSTSQPVGVTIVNERVLGTWLASHPRAFDEREVRGLVVAAAPRRHPD